MTQPSPDFPPVGAILSGPHWPDWVRVVRIEPHGASRVLIEAVTLDGQDRLISRVFKQTDLAGLVVETQVNQTPLSGDPTGFRLAAEATRIRLAYTFDPQFAVSLARIDPLPHQLEAVYYHMLRQPRLRFLLADDPGAGKTIMIGLLLKELKLRGVVTRTLIVAPANLVPQWQREMTEKFDETFDVVDRATLAARGSRAWEISDQCVTSLDFAWRPEALESLARARRWDLVVFDEAHKLAAYRRGSKLARTRRYRLGEVLTDHTEHMVLATATPHKGDPENFRLLLQLLDPDLFANTEILARAVQRQENPIFLRRLKEDMVGFDGKPLFPPRYVTTLGVELTEPEQQLYEAVTQYVADNFNQALAEDNRNVTFALIILQRRLASSVRAIRRSLEQRRDRLAALRDEVLANPRLLEAAQRGEEFSEETLEDAPEAERWEAEERALRYTLARNLEDLEAEIAILSTLAAQALAVETAGPEQKLNELRQVLTDRNLFQSGEKLLIFTESKDTLDYLVEHLAAWNLSVTWIDGAMSPPERYRAERAFYDDKQVMVATEAAGEGINLQFCHLMLNYDLPWNPTRLEQRMGRIHRYGQRYEVYIYNLVATTTREGMVLHALLNKLERMREGLGHDRVFDVVDQLLEGESLEYLIREALARRLTFDQVRERVLARLDQNQEQRLQEATLAGLATRYLDLARLRADQQRAAEARLVPAYIRAFFSQALNVLAPGRLERRDDGFGRLPYVPAALREVPEELRRRCGQPAESYPALTFDQADLKNHSHLTYIGPGQPLFEAVLHHILDRFGPDLARGAILRDPAGQVEGLFWLLIGQVEDGLGRLAGQRLFTVFQPLEEELTAKAQSSPRENNLKENFAPFASSRFQFIEVSPARLLDFEPPIELTTKAQSSPSENNLKENFAFLASSRFNLSQLSPEPVIEWSLDHILDPYLDALQTRRQAETRIIRDYLRRSFDVLIARSQGKLMEYEQKAARGTDMSLSLQEEHRHLDDLRRRQTTRLAEVERAAVLSLGAPQIIGVAAIVPAGEEVEPSPPRLIASSSPPMRRSDEVEGAAMEFVIVYEQQRGWTVEDVHTEGRGYDLLSRGPNGEVRYIEVKGRAATGAVELSANEWLKAEQLGLDYWLYVVTEAVQSPSLHRVQDPAHRLSEQEVIPQVRYRVAQEGWHRVAELPAEYKVNR
ncbi:MAG: DEAD/DEAH box helicase [Anaerolineae bacterium]|nr:DEAD/DEAH box helicase [Anaerolineae bacterium]